MNKIKQFSLANDLPKIKDLAQIKCNYKKNGIYNSFFTKPHDLLLTVELFRKRGFFLESIFGIDVLEGIIIAYHFAHYFKSENLLLRILTSHEKKNIPSISSIFSGAEWHERECYDFFGVIFDNHPNLKPLLLPDDLKIRPLLKEKDRKSLNVFLSV